MLSFIKKLNTQKSFTLGFFYLLSVNFYFFFIFIKTTSDRYGFLRIVNLVIYFMLTLSSIYLIPKSFIERIKNKYVLKLVSFFINQMYVFFVSAFFYQIFFFICLYKIDYSFSYNVNLLKLNSSLPGISNSDNINFVAIATGKINNVYEYLSKFILFYDKDILLYKSNIYEKTPKQLRNSTGSNSIYNKTIISRNAYILGNELESDFEKTIEVGNTFPDISTNFKPHDTIISVDDYKFLSIKDLKKYVFRNVNKVFKFKVERDKSVIFFNEKFNSSLNINYGFGARLYDTFKFEDSFFYNVRGNFENSSHTFMLTLAIYLHKNNYIFVNDSNICGTGEIKIDGSILPVAGVYNKLLTNINSGTNLFFLPRENLESKIWFNSYVSIINKKGFKKRLEKSKMTVVPVSNFREAFAYLLNNGYIKKNE